MGDRAKKFFSLIKLMRPYQWHKNIFVLAPPFFALKFTADTIYSISIATLSFILISSASYSLNDVFDAERDRKHPIKRNRPIASGAISYKTAVFLSIILALLSFILSLLVGISYIILIYFLLNLIYSIYLKDKKPIDVFVVSLGFVLRVIAGGIASGVEPSSWLIMTTFFIAMFISAIKREAEYENHSKIYEHIGVISATLTIMFYTMYVVLERKDTFLILSIFPVMFGIIRYYVLSEEYKGKDPSLLLIDKQIIISGIIYLIIFILSNLR